MRQMFAPFAVAYDHYRQHRRRSGSPQKTTTGSNNTATGAVALLSNTIGSNNTADGDGALLDNTSEPFESVELRMDAN
jgi:hypothetical protein